MRGKRSRSPGISLIETLLAMLILATALLALATVPLLTTRLISGNILRQRAMLVALSELETYESSPDRFPKIPSDLVHPAGMSFDFPTSVDRMVTVTVRWRGSQGAWASIALARRMPRQD